MTDDLRLLDVPKLTVAALKVTETARARILAAGGKVLTLDQLVLLAPTGKGYISLLIWRTYITISLFFANLINYYNRHKHFTP